MAKKVKQHTSAPVNSDEMMKLIKIILVVVIIVVAFYGITVLITKLQKEESQERNHESVPAVIQYEEIVLGTLLNQPESEYYVLVDKEENAYTSLFDSYLETYNGTENALTVYRANMDSVFNQFYVAEKSVLQPNRMSEFRVADFTLLKIKNKKIVEAYEGIDSVEKVLKELVKK